MIEYVLNLNNRKLHKRIDGMSRETCNLDQLTRFSVLTELPEDGNYFRCYRCNPVPAGEVSVEVAQ